MNRFAPPGASRVLIVEDNRDTADTTAMLLRLHGYDVAVAYDGRSALKTAQGYKPDVVLVDLSLPDLDGYVVADRLKQEGHERASFIAVSGHVPDDTEAGDGRFLDHLVKPVGKDLLVSVLQRLQAARSCG